MRACKIFWTFLLIIATKICFAQNKIYAGIQENKKTYLKKNFFFEKVIDARKNRDNIGFAYKVDLASEHPVDFKKGLTIEILSFLKRTFPNKLSTNKILVQVNHFEIGHLFPGQKNDTGFVSVDFSFFKLKNDSMSFLYNYVGRLAEHADVVAFSHSNRIKRAILMSLTKLDSALITLHSPMVYAKRNIDSLTKSNAIVSSATVLKEDSLKKVNNYPSDYYFMLGLHGSICTTHLMSGANINLLFQLKKHPRFLIGPKASLFIFGLYQASNIPSYTKYSTFNYDIGLRMLHQLKGNLFFNLNTQVLLGKEQYVYEYNPYSSYSPGNKSTTTKTENIIGFQLETGLYFIPVQKQGVYFGMDFFVRECSSTIFDSNAGFKLNLGIKF